MSESDPDAGGKADAALTRATAAQSKELWRKCTDLVAKYHEDLETWLMRRPVDNFKKLTDALRGDLLDQDALWQALDALQTVKQDLITHRQKISRIEQMTNQLEGEILNAPSSLDPREQDTSKTRQVYVIDLRGRLTEVFDVYNASEAKYKRCKSEYNLVADDNGIPIKREQQLSRGRSRHRRRSSDNSTSVDWDRADSRGRFIPRPKQQVDAKALKPQILETTMSSTAMKEWFITWTNYREASGWGQDTQKTQLAYLRMTISEEI